MRIAVVAGGWHYPLHLYRALAAQADADVDLFCIGHRSPDLAIVAHEANVALEGAYGPLFCIGHRSPDLAIVAHEANVALEGASGPLGALDLELYSEIASTGQLRELGWDFRLVDNTVGDWGFLNQWLEYMDSPLIEYDAILFMHDDTYIRRRDLFPMIRDLILSNPDTLLCTNGRYPEAPLGYARGSFEIFRPELIRMLGGRIPLAETGLDRTGKTDTPEGMDALSPWNALGEPLRKFMNERNLKVGYLSEYYRVSEFCIEGERGFLHRCDGAPWSYSAGLKALGIVV